MTKKELVPVLAKRLSITLAESNHVIDTMVSIITEELKKENDFSIQGFGTLERWEQNERPGRNLRAGTPFTIPSRVSVKFRPGLGLLSALNVSKEK